MTIKRIALRYLGLDPSLTPLRLQEIVRKEKPGAIVTLGQISTIVREFKRDGIDGHGDGHEHE